MVFLGACAQPQRATSPFESFPEGTLPPPAPPREPVRGPSFLILPVSELVFSPALADFSADKSVPAESPLRAWLDPQTPGGEAEPVSALEALEKVSRDYSVSPRLLLALLEFHASAASEGDRGAPLDRVFFRIPTPEPVLPASSPGRQMN